MRSSNTFKPFPSSPNTHQQLNPGAEAQPKTPISLWMMILIGISLTSAACSKTMVLQETDQAGPGTEIQTSKGSFSKASAVELQDMLANKDFTFVNVHIPFEGNIAETDLSIPFDKIEQNLGKLPQDRNAKIVLYCRSGRMSTIAAETLVNLGFTNIWELEGGMLAWEDAGLPIEVE